MTRFNYNDFFDYLRRTISLVSPLAMMVMVISFAAFSVEDKYGAGSWQYLSLRVMTILVAIGSSIIVLFDAFQRRKRVSKCNLFANIVVFILFASLCYLLIGFGLSNAANLHLIIKGKILS